MALLHSIKNYSVQLNDKIIVTANPLKSCLYCFINQYVTGKDICVPFAMWGKGLLWWNRPMIVLIRSPLQQMTVLHYLLQPWRLWPYWFLDLIASEWLPVTAEGRKNRYEECFSVADSCQSAQWYSSFKGSRAGDLLFLAYRYSLFIDSQTPCLVISSSDFPFSTLSSQSHMNNFLSRWPMTSNIPFPAIRCISPHCLPYSTKTWQNVSLTENVTSRWLECN